MQFKGDRATKEQRVRRLINRLEDYQRKTGYRFFLVKRGGEVVGYDERQNPIYSATGYTDFLKPVADAAVQRARASELWKRNPGDALAAQVAWALAQLPRVDERSEEKGNEGTLSLAEYERQSEVQIKAAVEKRADGVAERGGDVNLWLERLEVEISRLRRSLAKTVGAVRQEAMREKMEARDAQHRKLDAEMSGESEGEYPPTKVTPPPDANPSISEDTPDIYEAALALGARGFRVFPVWWLKEDGCACPKGAKCESPGKHPRISEWQILASTDPSPIKGWFKKQWPDANVGIVTGGASRLCVVDVDLKAGGDTSLMELCERHGIEWPDTLTVLTGSGGFHYYFTLPEGRSLRNTSGKLGPGIDTRCDGGLVVAPPSLHACGNRYEWANDLEPAPLPDWLLKLLTEDKTTTRPSHAKATSQAKGGAGIGLVITEGGRNDALFKIGCSMRGKGAELSEIEAELLDNNARRCSPPLPESEVLKIARSAASYAANRATVGA